MSVQPLRDFIVVSKEDGNKTTSSGLHIVVHEEKNVMGKVLAVGSGRVSMSGVVVPLEVTVGDKVIFNKSMATAVKDGETDVFVLREDQVLGIIR